MAELRGVNDQCVGIKRRSFIVGALAALPVAAFGQKLFTTWMVPFEIASLVLLVALVGAVWWSGGEGQ